MADNENKLTIYQSLNKLLNLDGFGFQGQTPSLPQSVGNQSPRDSRIIIKGNSPEEIYLKGLEMEQKRELQNKLFRTTDRGFQKSLQYESARLPAYVDFEGMEYYPIISSALDLFMEEATTIGINGKMLNIYSNKERIKSLLEEFFYDIVNVNVNLPFWTRNVCKYGDNFVLTYGERKKGITHIKQLVNYEIERFDRVQDGKPVVRFKERMTGDEFNTFEIAHFRLLGDDKYIPYGSCLLYNTKVNTANGIKEIKNIHKGDVVVGFDINTQKKFESKVLDVVCNGEKQTYKISTQHNFIKATDNHKILIYDNSDNRFKYKLVGDLNIGDGLIINNHDDYNEEIKINKEVEVKEYNGRVYDDFKDELKHIPDYVDKDLARLFGFLIGDGGVNYKRPYMVYFAYGTNDSNNKKYIELLEKFSGKKVYLRKNNKYANGIASAVVNSKLLALILKNMGFEGNSRTKRIPEWLFSTSLEIREAFLEGVQDADGSTNIDKWNCERFTIEMSNYDLVNDIKTLIQSIGYKSGKLCKRKKRENVVILNNKIISIADSYQLNYYISENKQTICSDIKNRLTNDFIIEKIKSIELDEIGFVYDIYVDNENHNFYANNIVVHNSVLNKVRRVFRQLIMAEDAMLTYRIVRAGEKKVFKIDVGNIDEDDMEAYMYKVATTFKKTAQVAPNDGQIDYRFNILGNDEDYFIPVRNANTQTGIDTLPGACLSLDTKIELLDGRSLPLNNIISEYNSGKELWSYSINPETGQIVPGKITWAGVTRKDTDVIRITLDNGESIVCTHDHKFPTKFNGKKEAKDLVVGESMWAFNKKFEKIRNSAHKTKYEMVYDHLNNDWVYTHQMVANYMKNIDEHEVFCFNEKYNDKPKTIIHHKNYNHLSNDPSNLCFMNHVDHIDYHSSHNKELQSSFDEETLKEHKRLRKEGLLKYMENLSESERQKIGDNIRNIHVNWLNSLSDEERKNFTELATRAVTSKKSKDNLRKTMQTPEYREKMRVHGKLIRSDAEINIKIKLAQSFTYNTRLLDYIVDFVNNNGTKLITLVNYLNNNETEFKDIFVELNKNKPFYKSFTNFSRKNILKIIKYYNYENWDDFINKIPCYNHKIVSIEYLTEKQDTGTITIDGNEELHGYHTFALSSGIFTYNSNLSDIQDIEYLRDNLFMGLSIPKPFLSFQDAAGAGKNMAQYDIRFAKKINRIQQAMIQELNKMAMVHLYLLGYGADDIKDFTLTLTNPSTQQEQLKAELLREKAQTYAELTRGESGIAAMSHTNAKRILFNLSDREIVQDLKEQKMEKVIMQELQDSPVTIKKTGLFADIDKRYGEPVEGAPLGAPQSGGTEQGGMGAPPAGGMPPVAGGVGEMPTPGGPAGGTPPPIPGLPNQTPSELPPVEAESVHGRKVLSEDEFNAHLEKLVYGNSVEPKARAEVRHKKIIRENDIKNGELNKNAMDMINEIDGLLKETQHLKKKKRKDDDVVIDDIDSLNV